MPNEKVTDKAEITSVNYEDILYIVDDPSGTPLSRKCTAQNLVIGGASEGAVADLISSTLTASKILVSDSSGKVSASSVDSSQVSKLEYLTVTEAIDLDDIALSVFGRTGDVIAQSDDYTWGQIDKTISSIADITTRNHSDLTAGTGADHSYINQDVQTTASPTFAGGAYTGNVDGSTNRTKFIGFHVLSTFVDLVNNAPQYGLGNSNITGYGATGNYVQLAGYYGLLLKSNTAEIKVNNDGIQSNCDILIESDSKKLLLGAGSDASLYYDGNDLIIKTDEVAASDLLIDCGTEKTLVLVEAVWDDMYFPLYHPDAALSAPDFEVLPGMTNLRAYHYDGGIKEEELFINTGLPHTWKEETDIDIHFNVSGSDNNSGNIKFILEYSIANAGDENPAEATTSVVIANPGLGVNGRIIGQTIAFPLTMTGKNISAKIVGRIYRDPTDAQDTYGSDAIIILPGIHFEVETHGSVTKLAK